jgi:hypothetical protein
VFKGNLRIFVTQRLSGSIDGIRLDRFRPGCVYEVGAVIGSYLLALGVARPVDDDTPETVPAPGRQLFGPLVVGDRSYVPRPRFVRDVRAQAADRPAKKKKTKPRR